MATARSSPQLIAPVVTVTESVLHVRCRNGFARAIDLVATVRDTASNARTRVVRTSGGPRLGAKRGHGHHKGLQVTVDCCGRRPPPGVLASGSSPQPDSRDMRLQDEDKAQTAKPEYSHRNEAHCCLGRSSPCL